MVLSDSELAGEVYCLWKHSERIVTLMVLPTSELAGDRTHTFQKPGQNAATSGIPGRAQEHHSGGIFASIPRG